MFCTVSRIRHKRHKAILPVDAWICCKVQGEWEHIEPWGRWDGEGSKPRIDICWWDEYPQIPSYVLWKPMNSMAFDPCRYPFHTPAQDPWIIPLLGCKWQLQIPWCRLFRFKRWYWMILVYRRFSLINTGQEIVLIIRSDLYTNIIQYNLLIIRSLNHFAIFRVPCVTEALMPEKGQLRRSKRWTTTSWSPRRSILSWKKREISRG